MMQQYDRAVQKAEESKRIVEEYLMGPESVQVVKAVGEILLSWEVMLMVFLFFAYRLGRLAVIEGFKVIK